MLKDQEMTKLDWEGGAGPTYAAKITNTSGWCWHIGRANWRDCLQPINNTYATGTKTRTTHAHELNFYMT